MSRKIPNSNCVQQNGQALPLGIALLAGALLFTLVLFNTGQTASEKTQLANTADAAVFSGLVWQARALNFQAYTNRAMVANQVSIGQMVSFASWTKYASILVRNVDYVGDFVWLIKPFTQIAKQIMTQVDNVVVNITEALIPVVDEVIGVLSTTQQAVFLSSFAATPQIVQKVIHRSDERYESDSAYLVIGLGENARAWNNFATRYDTRDSFLRKADLINRSKDEFTASRDIGQSQLLPGAPDKLELSGILRVWIKKEGRTNLIVDNGGDSYADSENGNQDQGSDSANGDQNQRSGSENSSGDSNDDEEWEWKGKDTLSLHIEEKKWTRRGPRWFHEEVPIGWGSRYVNGDFECEEDESGREICPKYMQENRWAESLADIEHEELDAEYNGIRAYYDLRDLSAENKDPRLALRVQVVLPQSEVKTASHLDGVGSNSVPAEPSRTGIGQGVFGTQDRMASDGMAAIASGEVYFHPPDDYIPDNRNGRYEIANLFNPYWEVRLTKTPVDRRFMAWGLRDEDLLADSASGVSEGIDRFMSERQNEIETLRRQRQALESQLSQTLDQTQRQLIQTQLDELTNRIAQAEALEFSTELAGLDLRDAMQQGLENMAQDQINEYEQELENYLEQESDALVEDFEQEIVGAVTDQLEQALEEAVEEAAESAVTSFLGG
ncbi:MAG: pilus assembly protein TadG-related protein [Candidatus Thiodiazotropha sp.]